MSIKIKIPCKDLDFIIVGGLLYINEFNNIYLNEEKKYIGENYSLFRIYDKKEKISITKSLIYSKFPVLLIQQKEKCYGYYYKPVINKSILSLKITHNNIKSEDKQSEKLSPENRLPETQSLEGNRSLKHSPENRLSETQSLEDKQSENTSAINITSDNVESKIIKSENLELENDLELEKANSESEYVEIEILFTDHLIATKEEVHLGLWDTKNIINFRKEPFYLKKYERKFWYDIVTDIVNGELNILFDANQIYINPDLMKDSLLRAKLFLNRLFDSKNLIHNEFISKDKPLNYGGNELYSLVTYEFYRALFYCSYPVFSEDFDKGLKIIENLIENEIFYIKIPELNESTVYYNTIGKINEGKIYGHTQFNTGLTGYPGGQAAILKILGKFLNEVKLDPGLKKKIENRFYEMLKFMDYIYSEDGISYTYPIFPTNESELFKSESSPFAFCSASTSEVVLAYIEAYIFTNSPEYLQKSIVLIKKLNPCGKNSFFRCSGFLRDASIKEYDGVSAVNIIEANIKLYNLLNNVDYKNNAIIIGSYILTFQYMYETNDLKIKYFADPMTKSFSPRLSIWDTLMWAETYFSLFKLTNKFFWLKLFKVTLFNAIEIQSEISGGVPESVVFNYINGLKTGPVENGITCWLLKIIGEYFKFYDIDYLKDDVDYIKKYDVIKNTVKIDYNVEYYRLSLFYRFKKYIKRKIPRILKRNIKKLFPYRIKAVYQHVDFTHIPSYYHKKNGRTDNLMFNYLKRENNIFVSLESDFNKNIIIDKVLFPKFSFDKEIISVKELKTIGKNISELEVVFEDFQKIFICVKSNAVDKCNFDGNNLIFETTLKSNWNNNGYFEIEMFLFEE